jgi:hypothetical protein
MSVALRIHEIAGGAPFPPSQREKKSTQLFFIVIFYNFVGELKSTQLFFFAKRSTPSTVRAMGTTGAAWWPKRKNQHAARR